MFQPSVTINAPACSGKKSNPFAAAKACAEANRLAVLRKLWSNHNPDGSAL